MTSLQRVRPGDLITADLWNTLIDKVNSLEAASTGATAGTRAVVISSLVPPSGIVRVGDFLTVNGQNFEFSSGSQRVFIDDVRADAFDAQSSSDTKLVFRIPTTITNVPLGGRPATLTVANSVSSAQRTLSLQSALQFVGAIDVNPKSVVPATIAAGAAATFEYELVCNATLEANYDLRATIHTAVNQADWQKQVHIFDTNQSTEISQLRLVTNQKKTIFVRINQVPAGTNLTSFDLVFDVASTSGNVGGTSTKTFVVGQLADETDTNVTVNVPSLEIVTGALGSTITSSTITIAGGDGAIVNLAYPTTFTFPAGLQGTAVYDVDVAFSDGATKWSVGFIRPPAPLLQLHTTLSIAEADVNNPQHSSAPNIAFTLRRDAGATAGRIQLKVKRQGQNKFAEKTMQLHIA